MKDYSKFSTKPDHVKCCNCGEEMLVDNDNTTCPICGKDGCLMDIEQEV